MPVLAEYYLWLKAAHIIMVICWMAGLFYLPRLFAYHAQAEKGSKQSETFKIMERRLLRIIMNPAMIGVFIFGVLLLSIPGLVEWSLKWMHFKLLLVFIMASFHGYLARCVKNFAKDQNDKSEKFYRILNELPPLLMIAIVLLAILKPF